MQISSAARAVAEPAVRAPWPDELARLRYFLPEAYLYQDRPVFCVGVEGRAERIVAAGALVRQPRRADGHGLWYLRVVPGEREEAWITSLARWAVERAQALGWSRLNLGQGFPMDSTPARALTALGFAADDPNEIYAVDARAMWARLQRIYLRMRARGMVPPGVRLSSLQPALLGPVRKFLLQHMPASVATLTLETEGYRPEHSLVLLVGGQLHGVLLCRRTGTKSFVGLRVVSPELRGGSGWANLLLLHASMTTTMQSGLAECHFEMNPALHLDTRQMALLFNARLVERRVILGIDLEKT